MTEKRFNIKPSAIVDDVTVIIDDEKKYSFPILDKELNYMFCKALNELAEENQTFREALKELKEIGDYQEMRIRELSDMNSLIEDEIDKKIAVLTDAQIKSFQNEDEELFGKVKFSIQVLRELKEVILE